MEKVMMSSKTSPLFRTINDKFQKNSSESGNNDS